MYRKGITKCGFIQQWGVNLWSACEVGGQTLVMCVRSCVWDGPLLPRILSLLLNPYWDWPLNKHMKALHYRTKCQLINIELGWTLSVTLGMNAPITQQIRLLQFRKNTSLFQKWKSHNSCPEASNGLKNWDPSPTAPSWIWMHILTSVKLIIHCRLLMLFCDKGNQNFL